jgi:hypothetical protein
MTQPSEWLTNLLETKKQAERTDSINAELKVRNERMLHSSATERWSAILDQLRADSGLLGDFCQMNDIPLGLTMGQPAVRLQVNGSTIRIVTARFDLNGHLIKVVRSHLRNGVEAPDSRESIKMKLMDNDEIVFLVEGAELYTIEQVSNRIMDSLLTEYRT